jgi:cytochrome b pre-mRNA-processing protein 3
MFGGRSDRDAYLPAYRAVVAIGRDPSWYRAGQVPDTVSGRFDVIAAIFSLLLLRLERETSAEARSASVLLTELFAEDMDGSLREIGIGDLVVGKHMGRLMGALGGRLGAFRKAGADVSELEAAANRNIFHEAAPSPEALRYVGERLARFREALEAASVEGLLAGRLPQP